MASEIKLRLQKVSEWISTSSEIAKGTVELAVESGLLQDTLTDICDGGGVAGSVFKLGAMAIPSDFLEADAEKRIAARLSRTFVKTLDAQLKERGQEFITAEAWKQYRNSKMEATAKKALAAEFTWLKVIGITGRKSSRSWPVVHELADLGRDIIWEAATLDSPSGSHELRQFTDDVRGLIHEALAATVDQLITDDVVQDALRVELPKAVRDSLELLARELKDLDRTYLFNEIPQNALYVPPNVRITDYRDPKISIEVDQLPKGDEQLYKAIETSKGTPQLIVILGEMGAGKSCLMRVTAAKLATTFIREKDDGIIFANWRSVYEEANLTDGIARHIKHTYGLPFPDLRNEERLIFLIDGFDEMRSHEPGEVDRYFESLVKLAKDHQSPLVVAMRSTIVNNQIRQQWRNNNALVIEVEEFGEPELNTWAQKWCLYRGVIDVSGKGLKDLCGGFSDIVRNPLLLFMLARYVQPLAKDRETALTRTEIFRTFVDETIAGKARLSGENLPISVVTQKYRLLLQEIAWIASWPRHGGKCPLDKLKSYADKDLEAFAFKNLRSAFVLHFFKPGKQYDEFEFHPEGFRHYLLAEWCVRTQWEALLYDEEEPTYPTGRNRVDAMNALAQFSLWGVERELISEIYEQLPSLLTSENAVLRQQAHIAFGLKGDIDLQKLYQRLRRHANIPPVHTWEANKEIGIPSTHTAADSLKMTRLLTNYWDQALLATFGLYRGLGKNSQEEEIFSNEENSFQQFMGLLTACRGVKSWGIFSFNSLPLKKLDLSMLPFFKANFREANLREANFCETNLREANLRSADLCSADLRSVDLRYAVLINAFLKDANLNDADLNDANLNNANLSNARLRYSSFRYTNLSNANLSNADLSYVDLYSANLSTANLSSSFLRNVNLSNANFQEANLSGVFLHNTSLDGAVLRNTNLSNAIFLRVNFRESHLLTQVQLEGDNPPIICNCIFSKEIDIDPDRDCNTMASVLHQRYPRKFQRLEHARKYVDGDEAFIFDNQ